MGLQREPSESSGSDKGDEETEIAVLRQHQTRFQKLEEAAKNFKRLMDSEQASVTAACKVCQAFLQDIGDTRDASTASKQMRKCNRESRERLFRDMDLHMVGDDCQNSTVVDTASDDFVYMLYSRIERAARGRSGHVEKADKKQRMQEKEQKDEQEQGAADGEEEAARGSEGTEAIVNSKIQQMIQHGKSVSSYEIPFPLAGRPTVGTDPCKRYCEQRGTELKKNHLILFKVESTSNQPVFVGKVKKILKFEEEFYVTVQYYGDGKDSFLASYQPLEFEDKQTGLKKPLTETYPLSIEGLSLRLIDWNFALTSSSPKHRLRSQTVKLLCTDYRPFLTDEQKKKIQAPNREAKQETNKRKSPPD